MFGAFGFVLKTLLQGFGKNISTQNAKEEIQEWLLVKLTMCFSISHKKQADKLWRICGIIARRYSKLSFCCCANCPDMTALSWPCRKAIWYYKHLIQEGGKQLRIKRRKILWAIGINICYEWDAKYSKEDFFQKMGILLNCQKKRRRRKSRSESISWEKRACRKTNNLESKWEELCKFFYLTYGKTRMKSKWIPNRSEKYILRSAQLQEGQHTLNRPWLHRDAQIWDGRSKNIMQISWCRTYHANCCSSSDLQGEL